ncbi:MAG: 3-phosphoserine/phosphohydroxythreonine transaminase [Candidatus Omnitrophica bacterium]|nr:3-phosphoserine/phosphohydroxythreonine transaminase [Candidatus Omnitrophota bacterium]
MTDRVYNFSAGPAVLPVPVLEEAQKNLLSLPGVGMSVLESSHRSPHFTEIIETAEANLRNLLNVPDNYSLLFLQGGASLQFSMIAINFLGGTEKPADYILTGSWGKKAIKEAKREGTVNVAWDGADGNYNRVPEASELKLSDDATYVHFTSNETIQGVEFPVEPSVGDTPLVCDSSSDILSRPIDIAKYDLLYAGAQKNMGPSGVTFVAISDRMLGKAPEQMHALLDYNLMAENKSLYNTPPTFGVYLVMLVTKWLIEEIGGLEQMAVINKQKASMLYDAIDESGGFYKGHAQLKSRSNMNVTWTLETPELEKEFLDEAKKQGLCELKGHRSVGGIRASIYNAMPVEGVTKLRDFMATFKESH